jgi:hypothetical protein
MLAEASVGGARKKIRGKGFKAYFRQYPKFLFTLLSHLSITLIL